MLVLPRDGDATLVVPAARGAPGRRAARRVRRSCRGARPRTRSRSWPALAEGRGDGRHRRPHVGPLPRRAARRHAGAPRSGGPATSSARSGCARTPPRSPPCAPPAPPPTGWPRSCKAGEIPLVGRTEAEVSADICRTASSPRATSRSTSPSSASGPNAASPHHHASDRVIERGRDRAVRLRRHDATATAATSPAPCAVGEPPAEIAEAYAVLLEAQQAAVAAAVVGTPCEEVDAVARRDHHRRRLRRALHPPHRPRHRHGGARGPLHRGRQRAAAGARPRLQRRARHLHRRAGGACASRTSWWPRPTARTP